MVTGRQRMSALTIALLTGILLYFPCKSFGRPCDVEPYLLAATEGGVFQLHLNGTKKLTLSNDTHVTFVDYHYGLGYVFWAGERKVSRARLSNGANPTVIAEGSAEIGGIHVDWISNRLYWWSIPHSDRIGAFDIATSKASSLKIGRDSSLYKLVTDQPKENNGRTRDVVRVDPKREGLPEDTPSGDCTPAASLPQQATSDSEDGMGRRLPTDTTAGSPGERQLAEHRPSQIGIAGHRDTKRRADLTHRYPEKRTPYLMFSGEHYIFTQPPDRNWIERLLLEADDNITSLDYHYRLDLVFWISEQGIVHSATLQNGTNIKTIINYTALSTSVRVVSLATDWINDILYYIVEDPTTFRIGAYNLSTETFHIVSSAFSGHASSLLYDSFSGFLYWIDLSTDAIARQNVTSALDLEVTYVARGYCFRDLALDFGNCSVSLYAADCRNRILEIANGEGVVRTVADNENGSFVMTVFEETFYWGTELHLYVAENGTGSLLWIYDGPWFELMDIVVVDPDKQPTSYPVMFPSPCPSATSVCVCVTSSPFVPTATVSSMPGHTIQVTSSPFVPTTTSSSFPVRQSPLPTVEITTPADTSEGDDPIILYIIIVIALFALLLVSSCFVFLICLRRETSKMKSYTVTGNSQEPNQMINYSFEPKRVDIREKQDHNGTQRSDLIHSSWTFESHSDRYAEEPESQEGIPSGDIDKDDHTPTTSLQDLPVYAEVRKFGRNRDSDKPCLKIDPDSDGPAPESREDMPGSVEDNYTPLSSLGDLSVPATNHDSDKADMSTHKHSLESVPASSDSAEGISPGSVAAEDVGARDPQLDLDTRYSAEFEAPGYETVV